jgi:hypothetical protein
MRGPFPRLRRPHRLQASKVCILLYVSSGLEKIIHSSPEVSVCKGVARTGFEVAFKLLGLGQGFKGNIELKFPRFELCGMATLTCVMFLKPLLYVRCMADIMFSGPCEAFKNVSVVHLV